MKRQKFLRDEVNTHASASFQDLYSALEKAGFRVTRRQVHFDLSDLVGLEIIEYDESSKAYRSPQTSLKEWSEGDYKAALRHSQKLMIDESENPAFVPGQGFMHESRVENLIMRPPVFHPEKNDELLLQHLEHGYPDVWNSIKKLGNSAQEYGPRIGWQGPTNSFETGPLFPSSWPTDFFHALTRGPYTVVYPSRKPALRVSDWKVADPGETVRFDPGEKLRELAGRIKFQEMKRLYDQIRGAYIDIASTVEHGSPLEGLCSSCPRLHFKIQS